MHHAVFYGIRRRRPEIKEEKKKANRSATCKLATSKLSYFWPRIVINTSPLYVRSIIPFLSNFHIILFNQSTFISLRIQSISPRLDLTQTYHTLHTTQYNKSIKNEPNNVNPKNPPSIPRIHIHLLPITNPNHNYNYKQLEPSKNPPPPRLARYIQPMEKPNKKPSPPKKL